jgi:hypothetical protein
MTDHEEKMVEARRYLAEVQRPASDQDRREDSETRSRVDDLLAIVEDLRERGERRDAAVLKFGRTTSLIMWATLAGAFVTLCLTMALAITLRSLHDQGVKRRADERVAQQRQTEAIEVNCRLIVRVAQQAGAGAKQEGASRAARKNQEILVAVVDEVLRKASPEVRAHITRLYHQLQRSGAVLTLPDCAQLARHPETLLPSKDARSKATKESR